MSAKKPRIKLSTYYIVIIVLLLITAAAYGAIRVAENNGYKLINTTVVYWVWYALVIEAILLVGKFVASLPKNELTRKSVKICVCIVSVLTIILTYLNCISQIDRGLNQYAEVTSDDGAYTVLLMRADVAIDGEHTDDGEPVEYTIYSGYRKINKYFCDCGDGLNSILLSNEPDASIKFEWTEESVRFFVEDRKDDPNFSMEVPFK